MNCIEETMPFTFIIVIIIFFVVVHLHKHIIVAAYAKDNS